MAATITKIVFNYTKKNFLGDVCEWGNKPGRLMSVTYCLNTGGFIVKNTSWPVQYTFTHIGNTAGVDWSSKANAEKVTRFIEKY